MKKQEKILKNVNFTTINKIKHLHVDPCNYNREEVSFKKIIKIIHNWLFDVLIREIMRLMIRLRTRGYLT